MSATKPAGQKPRNDDEGPISDNGSGCYACGSRPIGVEVVDDGETRNVCADHAPTGGDADE